MQRLIKITIISILFVLVAAAPVYAQSCDNIRPNSGGGLFGFLFGTAGTEVRAQRDCLTQQIRSQSQQYVAEVEAAAQVKIQEVRTQLAEVENKRFESAHQRDIAIAEAHASANAQIAGIESERDQSIAGIQGQRDIAIAEVIETGQTNRLIQNQSYFARNVFAVAAAVVIVLLAMAYVTVAMMEQRQPAVPKVVLIGAERFGATPYQLPNGSWGLLSDDGQIVHRYKRIESKPRMIEGEIV